MSHPQHKSDPKLGAEVNAHLRKLGIETPVLTRVIVNNNPELAIKTIETNMLAIMTTLGLDLKDDSLQDTPSRVAKMYVNEIFWGLDYNKFPKCTAVENKMNYNGSYVLERGISVLSTCEHHFQNIVGTACVAYVPNKHVLGLSKLNRIVEFFSKRPQVQERLTQQIMETIKYVAKTEDVAVYIKAQHFCVKARGVQDGNCDTITFAGSGVFGDNVNVNSDARREFLADCRYV